MQFIALLLVAGVAFAQYDTQPSGYGNNNPKHVQYVAGKSPRNKPVDYTKSNDAPGGSNVWGNWFNQQNLGQANNQGQQSVQKGGDQTNVGANSNAVNVGQSNNQGGPAYGSNGYKPVYDAPTYGAANPAPYNPFNFVGNNVFAQNLGQANAQGQQNYQQGGAQTNLGANSNQVNAGQSNNQGGNGGNYGGNGYKPSYDAPSYGGNAGASYGAVLIPINPAYGGGPGSFVKGNNFDLQNLGQTSNQGQSNAQIGGAQTNLGANANTVAVGQSNNQGGNAGYGKPSYDAPSYGGNAAGAIYVPDFSNFLKNNVYSQNLGQTNAQGQANYQKGGDQANVGVNTNAVNVGQSNNQGAGAAKGYDAPRYGGYNPGSFFAGNNIFAQNLGQTSNQGQTNAQIGGAQTNAGMNANTVNVGQDNNQGGSGPYKGYDAPRYGPAPPSYKPSPPAPAPYKPAPAPYKPAPPAYKPAPPAYKPSPPAPPAYKPAPAPYKPAPAPYKPAPAPYKPAPAPYKPEPKHEETGGYRLH